MKFLRTLRFHLTIDSISFSEITQMFIKVYLGKKKFAQNAQTFCFFVVGKARHRKRKSQSQTLYTFKYF